ncbi:MAG: copper chaperone PCu(A)C [Burkholderiales bacterium]|nr:copper chaperone PCu(A)C [Burkholderiales bacterium]MDE1926863.1 copper chaperone PCu(A)C [Burkholderiales bacterium]MDE2147416.1 copper chaperone PCu(A)C [Burkholderiales bacterium]MDE2505540.1 copper chaperone PCu(A)C [Burkholderiales bacterium]
MKFVRQWPVAATLLLAVAAQAGTSIRVEDAWARPTVHGQSGGGGFVTIVGGAQADRLLGASAGVAKVVELHTMEMDGNVMRMHAIAGIDIPAGATVELAPGKSHVMFMGLTRTLKKGAHFPLTLHFEKAGDVKVEMQVMNEPAPAMAPMKGH